MKQSIDAIIVVEGKQDASYISSLYDCECVVTNGYDIPSDTIDYLLTVSKLKTIIVLVDPDEAGKVIRDRLKTLLPNAIQIEVALSKCNRNNKHGVAECEKEELLTKLGSFATNSVQNSNKIKKFELINLLGNCPDGKKLIQAKFHTGHCNLKTLTRRLNSLNINIEDIKKFLDDANR